MRLHDRDTTPRATRRPPPTTVWGVLLLLAGLVLLLDATGLIAGEGVFWAVLFALGGGVFLYAFLTRRQHWWAAIPGGALLGLAAVLAVEQLAPAADDELTGSVFLASVGAGFWAVFARDRASWWPIIPGGVLVTLALVSALTGVVGDMGQGAVFFFGLAGTFGLLSVLPSGPRMRWPLFPAGGLAVLGTLSALGATTALELVNFVGPVALIIAGVYLLWHTVRPRHPRPPAV